MWPIQSPPSFKTRLGTSVPLYGLTGPTVLSLMGLAEQYSRALDRPITADLPHFDDWLSSS